MGLFDLCVHPIFVKGQLYCSSRTILEQIFSDPHLFKESRGLLDISFNWRERAAHGEVSWDVLIAQYGSRRPTVADVDYLLFVHGKENGSPSSYVSENSVT